MSGTATRSETSTYTEARAKYVLQKAWVDLVGLMSRGFIDREKAQKWYLNLKQLMDYEALEKFEIQGSGAHGVPSWSYEIVDDGSIYEDSDSGGIDLSDIPTGASFTVVARLKGSEFTRRKALDYLESQGWGNNGHFSEGASTVDKSFSKDGYGIKRTVYGVQP